MAELTIQQKLELYSKFSQLRSKYFEVVSCSKQDIKDAITALDQKFDADAVEWNQALPLPARQGLTIKQKAILMSYVALKRYEVI